MDRSERRHRTSNVIASRWATMRQHGDTDGQTMIGHRLAKNDGSGACGNKGCRICTAEKCWKRQKAKRERISGHRAEQAIGD